MSRPLSAVHSTGDDGDMEPPSEEIRKYQEQIRYRKAEGNLKEYSEKFRQKILDTRDWADRNSNWVFAEGARQKAPGKDHLGRPQYIPNPTTGDIGKDRYLEQLRRWNEAHMPPSLSTITVRHVMRADDRIKAVRGRDYRTTKDVAKKVEKKKKKAVVTADVDQDVDNEEEDMLAYNIKKWDRYVADCLDCGDALRYNEPTERRQTLYVDEPLAQDEFVVRKSRRASAVMS